MKVLLICLVYFVATQSFEGTAYLSGDVFTLKRGVQDYQNGVAVVSYQDSLETTGWDKLNIWTNNKFNDDMQASAAGYVEGYLTHFRISTHYMNLKQNIFNGKPIPQGVLDWFTQNRQFIEKNIAAPRDAFWRHVRNVHLQYLGLVQGYNAAKPAFNLTYEELQILPADIMDVISVADPSNERPQFDNMTSDELLNYLSDHGRCSALFKPVKNDFYFGHTTWYIYSSMTRIMKNYTLNYQAINTTAKTIVFSSYPGFLASNDDYLMTDSRLTVIETSLGIMNDSLYRLISPNSLLSWHRSVVATRMAYDAPSWVSYFSMYNSGTYCNQWLILDMTRPVESSNFFWIAEQMPGEVVSQDISTLVHTQGYFPSYNIPFSPRVREVLGYTALLKKRPDLANVLDYDKCARANIFRARQGNVESFEDFKHLLRYNDYQNDPLSQDNPRLAIAARADLAAEGHISCSGGYDTKASSINMAKGKIQFDAISSPTYEQQTAFNWDEAKCSSEIYPSLGLPKKWQFEWQHFDE